MELSLIDAGYAKNKGSWKKYMKEALPKAKSDDIKIVLSTLSSICGTVFKDYW